MSRYQRSFGLNTSMPSSGAEQAYHRVAASLQSFASTANRLGAQMSSAQGQKDAGQVEPSTKAPELRSPVTAYGRNYNRVVLEGHLAATQNSYRSQLDEIAAANAANPSAFAQAANEIRGNYLTTTAPEIRGSIAVDFDRYANGYVNKIQQNHNKLATKEAKDQVNAAFDSKHNSVLRFMRNGDEQSAYSEAEEAKSLIMESEVLSPEEKRERLKALDHGFVEQALLRDLEDLDIGEAWSLLDGMSDDVPEGYSPDEWDKFTSSAHTELKRREKREAQITSANIKEHAKIISDLEVEINTGQGDMVEQAKAVDRLFDNDLITPSKRTELLTKINKQADDAIQEALDVASVMKRLDGDDSIIIDKSVVDDVYAQHFLSTLPDEGGNAYKAMFADRMKYVPKQMRSEIQNGLRSGDTDLMIQSADMLDRLNQIPGLPENTFKKQDIAFSSHVLPLLQYMPPEKAVEIAQKNTDPGDMARIEGRQSVIAERFKNKAEKTEHFIDEANSRFDFEFFGNSVDDITRHQLAKDLQTLTEEYFVAGMDMDKAEDQAETDMKRIWGASIATGQTRTMKYPVEMFYGAGDNEWMAGQLSSDVSEVWPGEYDNIYLKSDDITAREAATGKPSYLIVIQDENGLTPLVDYRWRPDRDSTAAETIEENRESFERERKLKTGSPGARRYRGRKKNASN